MFREAEEMVGLQLEDLYHDDVVRIRLDKNLELLQLTFQSTPDTDQFRNAYQLAIGIATGKAIKFWLTDARNIKHMYPENQAWLKQQMGLLLQSQLHKFAILMAPECFVMTNPTKVYNQPAPVNEPPVSGKIKVHFDKEEAIRWLQAVNQTLQ